MRRAVPPDPNPSRLAIGARLRNVRTAQGLTLAQVAAAAGLSKGFLSRLERDDTSPSVATLVQLCQVLSLEVGSLFAEPEIQHIRLLDAPLVNFGGSGAVERLISPRSESQVQVVRSIMAPGASGGTDLYTISSNVEVLHVLDGEMTVRFVDRVVELVAGDALTLPGREPHTWDVGPTGAEAIWVIVPAPWSGSS